MIDDSPIALEASEAERDRRVEAGVAPLTKAEQKALEELVFLLTPGPKTLRDIAKHLGWSHHVVALRERKALAKLRSGLRKIEHEPPWRA